MNQHSSSPKSHIWLGRSIGDNDRYRLDQQLGSGGMGEVFLATDTRLGKPVALKLLRETLAIADDLDLKARFERECAICAALKSVHIVQVSDYGVTSEGYPFYVMEYLQGETLGQILAAQHQLSVERTCRIITQVCEGLELAHAGVVIWNRETDTSERIKVVHRDLKPDNIFLVPTALGELAKIIDFGIAKINSLQADYSSTTNVFLGTCHYAPPEQFDIRSEVNERSDIYSLGVILYEMLSGTDPFGFDFRNNRITNNAWLSAHASQSPLPLRSQPRCAEIPATLEAVVMRCLAKSPADRFTSVTELKNALQTAMGSPQTRSAAISLSPPSPPVPLATTTPSRSPSRRFPWLAGAGTVVALMIGAYALPRFNVSTLTRGDLATNPAVTVDPAVTVNASSQTPHQFSLTQTLTGTAPTLTTVLGADHQTLISGGETQAAGYYPIQIWDLNTKQIRRSLAQHTGAIQALSVSQTGLLASGSDDRTIKLWNLTTGELEKTLTGHTGSVLAVALSPDGKTLISGSEDKTVRIWDVQTGESQVLSEHSAAVHGVALSPDGKTIASCSADKTIRLWDAATGELLRTLGEPGGHRDTISSVAFSPDGQHLVSGGWEGFVKLWNVATGQLLNTFEGHTDRVTAATFVDNQTIASAGADRTLKLWNIETGQLLQTIPAHTDAVLSVTRLTDQRLASSGDTTIKIWR